jgi:hypothetical protein
VLSHGSYMERFCFIAKPFIMEAGGDFLLFLNDLPLSLDRQSFLFVEQGACQEYRGCHDWRDRSSFVLGVRLLVEIFCWAGVSPVAGFCLSSNDTIVSALLVHPPSESCFDPVKAILAQLASKSSVTVACRGPGFPDPRSECPDVSEKGRRTESIFSYESNLPWKSSTQFEN